MGNNFVLLAYSATGDKFGDKNQEAWPPKVTFNYSLGMEATKVTREGGIMDRVE